MSKYDKETKFYWLQLKEDFFEDDAIEWLEEQKPNGRDYAYFYLKLCLKSLKSNGILIRNVGNILIPYDNRKLAELTKMDFDTVTVAMELLKKIGLIKILENGEIYITQLENLIGSVSKGALKKQQQRLLSGQKVDKCPPKIKIELKDKVKDKYNNSIYDYLQENGFILTPIHYEIISQWEDNDLTRYAIKQAVSNNKYNIKYVESILNSYNRENIQTLQQAIEREEQFNKNKIKDYKKKEIVPEWFDKDLRIEEDIDGETRKLIEEIEGTSTNNS